GLGNISHVDTHQIRSRFASYHIVTVYAENIEEKSEGREKLKLILEELASRAGHKQSVDALAPAESQLQAIYAELGFRTAVNIKTGKWVRMSLDPRSQDEKPRSRGIRRRKD